VIPKFTISSGPFNVPMVEHVIIVRGSNEYEKVMNWYRLRQELYTAFPHLDKTRAHLMDEAHDEETRGWMKRILVFIDCDPEILKEICDRLGGQYIDVVDRYEESAHCTVCETCRWMIDEPKEEFEFPCSKCIHNYREGSV